jgi:hypothetical protein
MVYGAIKRKGVKGLYVKPEGTPGVGRLEHAAHVERVEDSEKVPSAHPEIASVEITELTFVCVRPSTFRRI